MRDSIHNEKYLVAIPPVVVTDNTAQVGIWINRSGYDSVSFAFLTGNLADTDATFAVLMEEASAADQSDHAAVADQDMLSQVEGSAPEVAASLTFANDNFASKIGYIGGKQYVRVTVTPAANTSAAPLAAVAKLSHASVRPVV
jgi:hypothetical protein